MKQTSIVTLVIVVLLALMVGSVGAIKPGSQEWIDTYFIKEPVAVEEKVWFEELLDFFKSEPEPVSYKVDYPYTASLTKEMVVIDSNTRIPSIVEITKQKVLYVATLERTSVYVNHSELERTGIATGFIKGVVYK